MKLLVMMRLQVSTCPFFCIVFVVVVSFGIVFMIFDIAVMFSQILSCHVMLLLAGFYWLVMLVPCVYGFLSVSIVSGACKLKTLNPTPETLISSRVCRAPRLVRRSASPLQPLANQV